jgi:UDP:flavonoid glycosyltransferase YjiC (YdhE family)
VDVLVTSGGYGTVQQSLRAGVPMIVSGVGQDKLHTGTLVNYTGFGIYHAVSQTTTELLRGAFEEIIGHEMYRYVVD